MSVNVSPLRFAPLLPVVLTTLLTVTHSPAQSAEILPYPMENLPIENGKINVPKLVQSMDAYVESVMEKVRELDQTIARAFATEASTLFGISEEEYLFLHQQSNVDSAPLTQFFKSGRRSSLNPIEEANRYFENAYQAITSGEYWFGREESLLVKDRQLYEQINQAVAAKLAKTEEGMKILDLRKERQALLSSLEEQAPLYEYLVERRQWWRYYPDYRDLLQDLEQDQYANPLR